MVRSIVRFLFVGVIALLTIRFGTVWSSTSASQDGCVPVPSGAVAWWPGEGNALDLVDGHNGTVASGTTFVSGKVGQAFNFNGSTGHMRVLDDGTGTLLDGFSELTVDAWIKPTSIGWPNPDSGGFTSAIVSKQDSTKANGVSYSFQLENGKLRFVILQTLNPVSKIGAVSTGDIPIGSWSHVAGVWRSGTQVELFVNGAQVSASTISEGPTPTIAADNDVPVNIGRIESFSGTFVGPAGFFDGLIDEVEIFDRGLSASEIAAIYEAGGFGKCPPVYRVLVPLVEN